MSIRDEDIKLKETEYARLAPPQHTVINTDGVTVQRHTHFKQQSKDLNTTLTPKATGY